MIQIERKVFSFFIENLSYCALNRRKGITLYKDLSDVNLLKEVKDWIENIFERKYFWNNVELPKPIYFFFPDRETVGFLNRIFEEFTYDEYKGYFEFCCEKISDQYNNDNLELFSQINFFHLIGSFRFFNQSNNRTDIYEKLAFILQNSNFHPLIKYSALQLMTIIEIEPSNDISNYRNPQLFREEYLGQLNSLEKNEFFRKYISFYSMYYYNNQYSPMQLINEKYIEKIISAGQINYGYLHTYLPQIAAHLIRIDPRRYKKEKIKNNIISIFDIYDPGDIDKILEFKEKVKVVYNG